MEFFRTERPIDADVNMTLDPLLKPWFWRTDFNNTKLIGLTDKLIKKIDRYVDKYGIDYILLAQSGKRIDSLLGLAARSDALAVVIYLVEKKNANLHPADTYPYTPLYNAIYYQAYASVFYLLTKENSVNDNKEIFSLASYPDLFLTQKNFDLHQHQLLVEQLLLKGASVVNKSIFPSIIYTFEHLKAMQLTIVADNPFFHIDNGQIRPKTLIEAILYVVDTQINLKGWQAFFFLQSTIIPMLIEESQLNTVIMQLENKNYAQAWLACGLLLDGHITNLLPSCFVNDAECGTLSYLSYDEKRSHDAINFYLKAAFFDNTLVELVNNLLWQSKIIGTISVDKRLSMVQPPLSILPSAVFFTQSPKCTFVDNESRFLSSVTMNR